MIYSSPALSRLLNVSSLSAWTLSGFVCLCQSTDDGVDVEGIKLESIASVPGSFGSDHGSPPSPEMDQEQDLFWRCNP